jgi:hypothetical protein
MHPTRPHGEAPSEDDITPAHLPDDLEAAYAQVRAQVRAERGAVPWLRSLPTAWRVGLVLATVVSVVALHLTHTQGGPSDASWLTWRAVPAVALLGLLAVTALLGLQPLWRPTPPEWHGWAWVAAATVAPALVAVGGPSQLGASSAAACFGLGLLFSLPVLGTWLLLDRGAPGTGRRLLMAATAGLGGNALLQLGCGASDPAHRLLEHGGIVVVLTVTVVCWFGRPVMQYGQRRP